MYIYNIALPRPTRIASETPKENGRQEVEKLANKAALALYLK
jgi:hypothetical protein